MELEDQLQLLVPDCIKDCLRAGIKVWMITGDKLETAKNIGLACNLIDPDMQPQFKTGQSVDEQIRAFSKSRLVEITGQWAELTEKVDELHGLFNTFDTNGNGRMDLKELEYCLSALKFAVPTAKLAELFHATDSDKDGTISRDEFVALMSATRLTMFQAVKFDIDEGLKMYKEIEDHEAYPISMLVNRTAFEVMYPGKVPAHLSAEEKKKLPTEEELESLRRGFFKLASVSKSLVFARAQPAMKKKMVTEIQARVPSALTLAIGDGANDTDMIQAAHIGVGIAGVEGTAATNSADYAVGTFNMLHTLLFVHGFWSYQRIAVLVNIIFYKASLVALTGYYFGFFSGFSGQQFFNDAPFQLYNVIYTALPVMVVAVFDKALPRDMLQNNPIAYRESKGTAFNPMVFTGWIFRAFLHSLIIFWIPYGVIGVQDVGDETGLSHDHWTFATVVFFCVVLVPTFLIILEMTSITLLHVFALFSSIFTLFLFTFFFSLSLTYDPDLYGVVAFFLSRPVYWLVMILTTALPILIELGYRGVLRDLRPSLVNILQERLRRKRRERKSSGGRVVSDDDMKTPGNGSLQAPGPEPRLASRSATMVVAGDDDEKQWATVTSPKHRKNVPSASKLDATHRKRDYSVARNENDKNENLRSAVVQAMLRFRNLTGSQFTSAAQARFQDHDTVNLKAGPKFHMDEHAGGAGGAAGAGGLGLGGTVEVQASSSTYVPPVG